MSRTILLNPGPVTLSQRVKAAAVAEDLCHREPEFATLTRSINRDLLDIYAESRKAYSSVLLTGSGTAAVEAMLASFAPDTAKTLVISNGVYGERMAGILRVHNKPHETLQFDWTQPIDSNAVADRLRNANDIAAIATVHHETTTGRLNDLDGVGELCAKHSIPMLLDAVSSFAAEDIRFQDWNVGAAAATANKCLQSIPGISFVIAGDRLWQQAPCNAGSLYLDLRSYHAGQATSGFSPFTQSVQVMLGLREAIKEFNEDGGWRGRQKLFRQRADAVHTCLENAGIKPLLDPTHYSCVLHSYCLPQNLAYDALHDALKSHGYIIYAGQGELASRIFRIAHMGDITPLEIDALCKLLRETLARGRK